MRMIDVLNMMAKGEIKEGTKLKIGYKIYDYIKDYTESENCSFVNKEDDRTEFLEDNEFITTDFLNLEVELIPQEEKKYRVRFELLGSSKKGSFLSWEKCPYGVFLSIQESTGDIKTQFTKSELQSIQPVREFLEDIEGEYELIEVEDDAVN